jgi:hypothetical protein
MPDNKSSKFFFFFFYELKLDDDVLQKSADSQHHRPIPGSTGQFPLAATFSGDRRLNPVKSSRQHSRRW